MFNLEMKITWKELAPSLQSMFKTLQSQITDNRQEIDNINTDMDNINETLNQINLDIDKINNDITNIRNEIQNTYNDLKQYIDNSIEENITNVKNELIEQMGEYDFLNMAPKIGYYQDDTIEVISKYNMNNVISYGSGTNPIMTTDKFGRTIMYFLANSGSYDDNANYKLYYGYTENITQPMTFINEALVIKDAPNNYIQKLISCDNDWICIGYGNKYYLYDTNYSTDPNDWTNRKDVTSLVSSRMTRYGFKFIRKYGTIAIAYCTTNSYLEENWGKLDIFRYSDLKLLHSYDLENISHYMTIADGNDYLDPGEKNHNFSDPGNTTTTYSSWCNSSFIIIDDQELVSFNNYGIGFTHYINGSRQNNLSGGDCRIIYNVPKSIFMGNTGTITVLNSKKWNIYDRSYDMALYHYFGNQAYFTVSFSSLDKLTYCVSCRRDGFTTAACQLDDTIQRDCPVTDGYGFYNGTIISVNVCWPSDSSLWGKRLLKPYFMFDKVYLYASSKQQNGLVQITEFQKYKNNSGQLMSNVIEPTPGYYQAVGYISSGQRPFYVSTRNNPRGFTSNKMDNDSAEYWSTMSNGSNIDCYKWTGNTQYAKDASKTFTGVYDPNYWNQSIYGNKAKSLQINQINYNAVGDYLVVFVNDSYSYYNDDSYTSNPEYANTFYIGLVFRDGTRKSFGIDNNSRYGPLYTFCHDVSNSGYDYKGTLNYRAQSSCCPSKYEMVFVIDYYKNWDGGYTNKQFLITFNNTFTDFTIKEIVHKTYGYQSLLNECPSLQYSGPRYGFVETGNGWVKYPMIFQTQYPMISGEGTRYTDAQFINSFNSNSNLYYMYLQSSQGLIAYIPNIPIFIGGYFSIIENPIAVTLNPNSENYIYLERDSQDREKIIATVETVATIQEGDRVFSKILLAKITTDNANMIDVQYYRINNGYNDYTFHQNDWGGGNR